MSFLTQNWPILLFAGVMIYMHFFMHRGHGRHRHHDRAADPASGRTDGARDPVPEQPKQDRHRHGGC